MSSILFQILYIVQVYERHSVQQISLCDGGNTISADGTAEGVKRAIVSQMVISLCWHAHTDHAID